MRERIDSIVRFFLYAVIFWLPYSPAAVETFVILSLILWIVKRSMAVKKKDVKSFVAGFQMPSSILNREIFWFLLAGVISIVGSLFPSRSVHGFFTKTLEWFIVYFLVIEFFKTKKHIYIALSVFLFSSLVTCVDSFIQFYVTGKDIFLGHVIPVFSRATAAFKGGPNTLAGYLAILVPFAFSLHFINYKRRIFYVLAVFVFLISLWSLMITFTRGAWVGVGAGIMFFLIVLSQRKKTPLFLLWFIVLAVGFVVLVLFFQKFGEGKTSVNWRMGVWLDSLVMIKDRPFFGHGLNTYMEIFQIYRRGFQDNATYAHNCYIQMAAEIGIVGLICFMGIIYKMVQATLKNFSRLNHFNILSLGILSGLLAFLIHAATDTNFYSLQLSVYFWYSVGILIAINEILNSKTKHTYEK